MARRKYGRSSDALSAAGRGIKPDEPAPSGQLPLSDAEPSSPQPPATDQADAKSAQHFSSGLGEQIRQQRAYAEQQQQVDALDAYISHYFQGALPNERAWLRANPHNLQNPMLVHQAAGIALQRGIPRHDPEFLRFIGQLLDQHHAAMQAPAPAPPPPAPLPLPEPAHAAHVDVETHDSEPEESPMPQHFSAPVSRGDHGHAVEPEPTMGTIKLIPEQRDIAHRSGISEVEYARQLIRMQKMKSSGVIK
jgi:hypothetical protein